MNRPASCHVFKCIFLLFSGALLVSPSQDYDFTGNEYLTELCNTLKQKLPKNDQDCNRLLSHIALRYFGADNDLENAERLLLTAVSNQGKPEGKIYWDRLFLKLKQKYAPLETLLKAIGLKYVPKNKYGWKNVKNCMNQLDDCATSEDRIKIESISNKYTMDSNSDKLKTDYLEDFKELAIIYENVLLEEKDKLLHSCGFKVVPSNFEDAFYKLLKDYVVVNALCRRYGCALGLRNICDGFNDKNYPEFQNQMATAEKILKEFKNEQVRQTGCLIQYTHDLAELTTKDSSHVSKKFNDLWEKLWKGTVELFIESSADFKMQKSKDLRSAIIRIWTAENSDDALKVWQEDLQIWKAYKNTRTEKDFAEIHNLAKLSENQLRKFSVNRLKTKGASMLDRNFAINLYTSTNRDNVRYRKCLGVLTFSDYQVIKDLKSRFEATWNDIPDESIRNIRFCSKLVQLRQVTSNSDFLGADLKSLPKTCIPTRQDYETYIKKTNLANDQQMKDVIDIILNLYSYTAS